MDGIKNSGEFPARLRALREKRRLSRIVLSELCGLNKDAVRRYERSESLPTLGSLMALCDFFGVTLDELCGAPPEQLEVQMTFERQAKKK